MRGLIALVAALPLALAGSSSVSRPTPVHNSHPMTDLTCVVAQDVYRKELWWEVL